MTTTIPFAAAGGRAPGQEPHSAHGRRHPRRTVGPGLRRCLRRASAPGHQAGGGDTGAAQLAAVSNAAIPLGALRGGGISDASLVSVVCAGSGGRSRTNGS